MKQLNLKSLRASIEAINFEKGMIDLDDKNFTISNEVLFGYQHYVSFTCLKIIRVLVSQLYTNKEWNADLTFSFSVKDVHTKIMNLKESEYPRYAQIKETIKNLKQCVFFPQNMTKLDGIRWIEDAAYSSDRIDITINPEILRFVEVKKNYSTIALDTILTFKNIYSLRIYESIFARIHRDGNGIVYKTFNNGNKIAIPFTIHEFRMISGTIDTYAKITHLKNKCILPAVEEISQKTEIKIVDVQLLKNRSRKSVDTVEFHIIRNNIGNAQSDLKDEDDELLNEMKVLNRNYIGTIFDEYEIRYSDKELYELEKLYRSIDYDAAAFNADFEVARKNAKFNLPKYMLKMVSNRIENTLRNKDFDTIVQKWNNFCEKTSGLKRCEQPTRGDEKLFLDLIKKDIATADIERGIEKATRAEFFIKNMGGNLSSFLINFEKIVNGNYDRIYKDKKSKNLDVYVLSAEDEEAYAQKAQEDEDWFNSLPEEYEG